MVQRKMLPPLMTDSWMAKLSLRSRAVAALAACALLAALLRWWLPGSGSTAGHGLRADLTTRYNAHAAAHRCSEVASFVQSPGSSALVLNDTAAQQTFERVYSTLAWGADGGGSGTGSTRGVTRYARQILELVMHKYDLNSIIDAPCGAMVWMPIILERLRASIPCLRYLGLDIVRNVQADNVRKFEKQASWMSFQVSDFSQEPLPQGYDLIFCRDALQHLRPTLIFSTLERFTAALDGSPSRFLLVGSYERGHNRPIRTGDYFHIDLRQPPFSMTPLDIFYEVEQEKGQPKIMLLFSGQQLAALDLKEMQRNATGLGMVDLQKGGRGLLAAQAAGAAA